MGDPHGLQNIYKKIDLIPEGSDWVILGDCGIGFREHLVDMNNLEQLSNFVYNKNIRLFLLRGNHDSPKWWEYPPVFPNLFFVQDYSTIHLPNNEKVLCVGGGVSIDRIIRNEHVDFWKGEITPDVPEDLKPHEYVFSHDCPSYVNKPTKSLEGYPALKLDRSLLRDCDIQRQKIDRIIEKTQPKRVFYGHMHNSFSEVVDNRRFRCLNIEELFLFDYEKYT